MSPTEKTLWSKLRDHQLAGLHIRRQQPIGHFVADFYCATAKLVIEIDGDSHSEPSQQAYDALRTRWLVSQGYRVIRFTNDDVAKRLTGVLLAIAADVRTHLKNQPPDQ